MFSNDVKKINELIAEKIMGLDSQNALDYTESISSAMLVIDKLKEKYILEIQIDKESVECRLMNEYPGNEDKLFTALAVEADTIALAVCIAALRSIEN